MLPCTLVRMLRTPATSSTSRTPGPALTPVPGPAGTRMTRLRAVLADDAVRDGVALERDAASGASSSPGRPWWPSRRPAAPRWPCRSRPRRAPCWSPTTTRALKLKRRPPLTTAAQRRIFTTRSSRPSCRARGRGLCHVTLDLACAGIVRFRDPARRSRWPADVRTATRPRAPRRPGP